MSDVSDASADTVFEGFVHDLAKQRLGEDLKEVDLYFAGPPLMAGAVEQEIVRHYRVPSDQVFYDRFGEPYPLRSCYERRPDSSDEKSR